MYGFRVIVSSARTSSGGRRNPSMSGSTALNETRVRWLDRHQTRVATESRLRVLVAHECRNSDGFFNRGKSRHMRGHESEFRQGDRPFATKPLHERTPDRIKIFKPPCWRRTTHNTVNSSRHCFGLYPLEAETTGLDCSSERNRSSCLKLSTDSPTSYTLCPASAA